MSFPLPPLFVNFFKTETSPLKLSILNGTSAAKAEPVALLQSMQWQLRAPSGSIVGIL